MNDIRFLGVVIAATDTGFVVNRDDDGPRAFVPAREAMTAGDLIAGDRVSFGLHPGGMAYDVALARRGRHLAAQEAAK